MPTSINKTTPSPKLKLGQSVDAENEKTPKTLTNRRLISSSNHKGAKGQTCIGQGKVRRAVQHVGVNAGSPYQGEVRWLKRRPIVYWTRE